MPEKILNLFFYGPLQHIKISDSHDLQGGLYSKFRNLHWWYWDVNGMHWWPWHKKL